VSGPRRIPEAWVAPRLFPVGVDGLTTDDYYTPRTVFDALGLSFDVDVAAPTGGVPWIPADRFYDAEADGLAQPWFGRVWMNPPYSNVGPWWRRFAAHRHGVALLPVAKSVWLNDVWADADAVALGRQGGEMLFVRPDNPKPLRIWFPVLFAAFGDECCAAIARLGPVR
jgi:DNA N-6-adenine-methyltransferase (Dam)